MNYEQYILELTCQALGCSNLECIYAKDRRKCPKQEEALAMCDVLCNTIEDET